MAEAGSTCHDFIRCTSPPSMPAQAPRRSIEALSCVFTHRVSPPDHHEQVGRQLGLSCCRTGDFDSSPSARRRLMSWKDEKRHMIGWQDAIQGKETRTSSCFGQRCLTEGAVLIYSGFPWLRSGNLPIYLGVWLLAGIGSFLPLTSLPLMLGTGNCHRDSMIL